MSDRRICLTIFVAGSIASLALVAERSNATVPASISPHSVDHRATTESLGGTERFLTFISTDKPIYRTGEKVYIRGVMLNAATKTPLPDGQPTYATIMIRGTKGELVSSCSVAATNSIWAFAWEVPEGQGGGEYTIRASYPGQGYAPAERKFDVRSYRAPRLKSQITFLRDGYGPGETVTATLDVKRAEGGIPEGAQVTVNALVDGKQITGVPGKVDAKGLCTVTFNLPRVISRGDGTLSLTIQDGGVIESASKTIPILLQTLDLQMYAEGGDLLAGYKNRVYVQALQPTGKPADLIANVVSDEPGKENVAVAQFRTEHEGRGRFEFIPNLKRHYSLRILKPAGIKKVFPLPNVKTQGAIIHSNKDTFKKGQPLTFQIASTHKKIRLTAAKREKELVSINLEQPAGFKPGVLNDVSLPLPSDADGVLTVTVWDERDLPLAERLIFREQAKPLNVSLKTNKTSYIPGDNPTVTIKTTDASGKPISAVVGITVTDDSVVQMVEKREQAPRLPVMVLLEPEVKDLADAHIYLDAKNPRAPLATDLLLGTQGWRRFAVMDVDKFVADYGDRARRAMALKDQRNVGWNGVPTGGALGKPSRLIHARIGETGVKGPIALPEEIGRIEGPRDTNLFQVEPTVLDERHYTSGRDERHQKTSASLPEGSPIPDGDDIAPLGQLAQMTGVNRYTFFSAPGVQRNTIAVREFAHQVRQDRKPTDRIDFAETLYWNAGIKTDPKTGEATINFGLNDSVTTFEVFADAFANSGSIGTSHYDLKSIQPFYAEAKLPLEVTAGDKVLLPINLINATAKSLQDAKVTVDLPTPLCRLLPMLKAPQQLRAGERSRCIQPIEIGFGKGPKEFVLNAKADTYQDKVVRLLSVKPSGFPVEKAFGGIIEPGKPISLNIAIEKDAVPQSVVSEASVYPSPLANLTGALERMILDPCGCFEQTSSTSYPLTMAQQYFLSHSNVDPKLVETSREKLDAGYKRLLSYWCPDRGYEWFGENPGHEALTAFGILHFTDMAQVKDVDKNMISTTRAWLMKQKDGKGGFTRNRRALHSWIEDKDCSNAYIVWALLESGQQPVDLKLELESLKTAANASKNNYVKALAANAFHLSGDKHEAKRLMQLLSKMQKADGSVDAVTSSIVGSGGESLEVEGTALATLAWLREPEFAGNVEKSIKYLSDSCKAGRYGSTQATVLALRAIVNYDKQRASAATPGKVRLYADGQPIGDWIAFDKSTQEAIKFPDLSELLSSGGDHHVEIHMEGGHPMPYSLAVKYNTITPASDKECKVNLSVKLAQDKITEGASTEALVTVVNTAKETIPTPVAIIGLPGGLEPRHDQLKELVKKKTIDAYEVRGREVVLYWRALNANEKVQIPISLVAAVPGSYTGPASRAYLYYTDEHKKWVSGTHVEIAAKN